MSTDVEDLLPFGLGGSAVVVLGLDQSAGFVGRTHITQMICASKLKGSYVLRNPAIAQAVDLLIAEDASTARHFPHLETPMRRELPASGRPHIFNVDERHEDLTPRTCEERTCRLVCRFQGIQSCAETGARSPVAGFHMR
jgi:hypothetical protein